jgi:L-ascorbate metabolism protein UlaG (beta-lactamase superfamily)
LRWLGMAGFLINGRGTTLMVDPLLSGFDMPVMIEFPIAAADVPKLDAVLTHSDNDHYRVPTCQQKGEAMPSPATAAQNPGAITKVTEPSRR